MSSPQQAEAYNRMEKLRDPSHVQALALDELTSLFSEAGFQDVKTQFYKHEVELEQVFRGRSQMRAMATGFARYLPKIWVSIACAWGRTA